MSLIRKIIYLIIFSDWSNVMIAHSLGVDLLIIVEVRRCLKSYKGSFHTILCLDDGELDELFLELQDEKVPVGMLMNKNQVIENTIQGGMYE